MLAKKIFIAFVGLLFVFGLVLSAQAQTTTSTSPTSTMVNQLIAPVRQIGNLTQITQQDFAGIKTGWFDNLWRDIKIIFTFNPVKKADLELEKATAILLKAQQKIEKKNYDPAEAEKELAKAQARYQRVIDKMNQRLEAYKQRHPQDERVEKLLDKYTDLSLKQQALLEMLDNKLPPQAKPRLKALERLQLKSTLPVINKLDGGERFKNRLKKMIVNDPDNFRQQVMRIRALDKLDDMNLDSDTKEKIEELKQEIEPLWQEVQGAYRQARQKHQQTIEELRKEAEENKDKLLNDPEARREFMKKVNQQMKTLREENREIYQEKKEKVKQFIEEHKDELLEIKKEVKPLLKEKATEKAEQRMELKTQTHKQLKTQLKQNANTQQGEDMEHEMQTQVKTRLKTHLHQVGEHEGNSNNQE